MAPSQVWQPCHIAGVTSQTAAIMFGRDPALTPSTLQGHLLHTHGGCGGRAETGLVLLRGPGCAGTPSQVTEERETKPSEARLADSGSQAFKN